MSDTGPEGLTRLFGRIPDSRPREGLFIKQEYLTPLERAKSRQLQENDAIRQIKLQQLYADALRKAKSYKAANLSRQANNPASVPVSISAV